MEFENYNATASDYVHLRIPVGCETILAHIPNPSESHILDAGCGTGNYSFVLSPKVKKITGLEFNDGMIAEARKKCKDLANVEIMQGSLLNPLPYADGAFDAITVNQVMHHLDTGAPFTNVAQLIKEFSRVLKAGGALIINTVTPEQHRACWFMPIFPKCLEKYAARMPSAGWGEEAYEAAGLSFECITDTTPLGSMRAYFNFGGLFDKKWRSIDSFFAMVEKEELDASLERVEKMMLDGSFIGYVNECEKLRMEIGYSAFYIGKKD